MSEQSTKQTQRSLRVNRVRTKITGTPERPRLAVNVSNKQVSAQLIDDTSNKTIVGVTSEAGPKDITSKTDKAIWAGEQIAAEAKKKKIKAAVLDRRYKRFHGRIKAFADAARKAGLEI